MILLDSKSITIDGKWLAYATITYNDSALNIAATYTCSEVVNKPSIVNQKFECIGSNLRYIPAEGKDLPPWFEKHLLVIKHFEQEWKRKWYLEYDGTFSKGTMIYVRDDGYYNVQWNSIYDGAGRIDFADFDSGAVRITGYLIRPGM